METSKNRLNRSMNDLIEQYENELNAIKADYEQNKEKIRQELYQTLAEKQESIIETKRAKKQNRALRKLCYYVKKLTKRIKRKFQKLILTFRRGGKPRLLYFYRL